MDISKEILNPIDEALTRHSMTPAAISDARMALEGSVWEELDKSVHEGFRTAQEAQDMYMQWRIPIWAKSRSGGL